MQVYYFSFLKNATIFDAINNMSLLLDMATPLPAAFPPIVNDAIKAVIHKVTGRTGILKVLAIESATVTPAEPEIIPQISPITSLQKDETLLAFFLNNTAVLAPFTFLAPIEWNGFSSAVETATPIISKIIPNKINIITKTIPKSILAFGNTNSDTKEKQNDITNANTVMITIHLVLLFFFFIFFVIILPISTKKSHLALINVKWLSK